METLDDYLTRLASDSPTPGGGSAATLVARLAAALAAMVARIDVRSERFAEHRAWAQRVVARADRLRAELAVAGERDEQAYARVVEASAMPRVTDRDKQMRTQALQTALFAAAEEPLRAGALALDVLRLAHDLLEIPNRFIASDVGCAAEFAHAAIRACAYNVRINHAFLTDASAVARQAQQLGMLVRESDALHAAVTRDVGALIGV